MRIMEKKMETTISILGFYKDNRKDNGDHYVVYWGYIRIMEKKMETAM